jgi:hypothetical protein
VILRDGIVAGLGSMARLLLIRCAAASSPG